jgi:hypothetical protein
VLHTHTSRSIPLPIKVTMLPQKQVNSSAGQLPIPVSSKRRFIHLIAGVNTPQRQAIAAQGAKKPATINYNPD